MSNNVFVLYDSKIETEISLNKFDKILVLAGIPENKIKHISLTEYNQYLIDNNFNFHSYIIAINQTYKEINQIYSEKLNIPIFDFFTKEFSTKKNNLILFGLLFSVNSIHEPAYKKYSWIFIQKFVKEYQEFIKDTEVVEDYDYLDNVPTETVQTVELVSEETQEEIVEPTVEIVDEKQEIIIESDLSYEFLLDFYKNNIELFKYFNLIQQQLKSIDNSDNV